MSTQPIEVAPATQNPERTTWTTEQLQEDFEVQGFSMYMCVVKRRDNGQVGSLSFHRDDQLGRIYTDFVPHDGPECGNGVKP